MCALLGRARRARGCVTPGDDRLETRVYAVKRYLFRLGHAASSARFATSIEQLVVGLAPVMGWGPAPRGGAERARFVRAHRKSVQRWLDDLQAAGLVAHEPERDERGPLVAHPDRAARRARRRADELAVAQGARARLARRERDGVAPVAPGARWQASGAGRRCPTARSRARLARRRACAAHERRRRAAVERAIACRRALASIADF